MTIDADPARPRPGAPAAPKKNSFERIAGALFSPGETFADIARKPDFLVPLLVIIIIGYVCTFVMVPRMDWDAVGAQQEQALKKQTRT